MGDKQRTPTDVKIYEYMDIHTVNDKCRGQWVMWGCEEYNPCSVQKRFFPIDKIYTPLARLRQFINIYLLKNRNTWKIKTFT